MRMCERVPNGEERLNEDSPGSLAAAQAPLGFKLHRYREHPIRFPSRFLGFPMEGTFSMSEEVTPTLVALIPGRVMALGLLLLWSPRTAWVWLERGVDVALTPSASAPAAAVAMSSAKPLEKKCDVNVDFDVDVGFARVGNSNVEVELGQGET